MLFKTLVKHGLRNQEARILQRQHVNFQEDILEIKRANTKSRHGVRHVPIPDDFRHRLREHVKEYCDVCDDYLFVSNRGTYISGRYFEKLIRRAAVSAGLYPDHVTVDNVTDEILYEKRVVPHSLRHTYAPQILRNGTPIEDVSDLLGRGNIQTIIDHYRHLNVEDFRKHVDNAAIG